MRNVEVKTKIVFSWKTYSNNLDLQLKKKNIFYSVSSIFQYSESY